MNWIIFQSNVLFLWTTKNIFMPCLFWVHFWSLHEKKVMPTKKGIHLLYLFFHGQLFIHPFTNFTQLHITLLFITITARNWQVFKKVKCNFNANFLHMHPLYHFWFTCLCLLSTIRGGFGFLSSLEICLWCNTIVF